MIDIGMEQIQLQGRVWLINGYLKVGTASASQVALTPPDGYIHIYTKDTGTTTFYFKDDAGVEHEIGASGPSAGEILVADGSCAPPVMLTTEDECDFLYEG